MQVKKRYWICLVLFLSLLPLISASEVISNTTYSTGSSIVVNGTSYGIIVSQGNGTGLALTRGNDTLGFFLGECREFFDQMLCYAEKIDKTARLTLYDQNARLIVSRSVSKTMDISIGTHVSINISINNTGRSRAEDIKVTMSYPEGMSLIDVTACKVSGNALMYEGTVAPGHSVVCTAILVPESAVSGMIDVAYSYSTVSGTYEDSLSSIEVSAKTPDWYVVRVSPTTLGIGEKITIFMNFTANETANLTLQSVEVPLGDRFLFVESSYVNTNMIGNTLIFSRKIRQNSSFVYEANLTAIKSGAVPLNISIAYKDHEVIDFLLPYQINVSMHPLAVEIERDDSGVLEPGRTEHFRVLVSNPNRGFEVSKYEVNIVSDLPGFDVGTDQVPVSGASMRRIVYDTYYSPPVVNETMTAKITATILGYDGFLQTLFGEAELEVMVSPLGKIEILKGLNYSTIDGKNTAQVKVFVKSTYGRTLSDLSIEEKIPSIFYYKGETSGKVTVPAGGLIEAYAYELIIPFDHGTEEVIDIETVASYSYGGKEMHATATVAADTQRIHRFIYPKKVADDSMPQVSEPIVISESKRGWFILFIIFDILVLIVFTLYFFGINLVSKARSGILLGWIWLKHRRVRKKDRKIQEQMASITDEEQRIAEEEARVEELIIQLEREIERQNKVLPGYVDANSKKIESLEIQFARLEEQKGAIEKKISSMKGKEDEVVKQQEEITRKKDEIMGKTDSLKQRKKKLVTDISSFKDTLLKLHDQIEKMKDQKGIFKKHAETLHQAQLHVIQARLEDVEARHKELKDHEESLKKKRFQIRKEGESMQKLLNIRRPRQER